MVSDVNIFAQKWSKIAAAKKFLTNFFSLCSLRLNALCPHFQSPMSKLFRFSESLGKTNGKKWSQIWIILLIKGVKPPRNFFFIFFFYLFIFFFCDEFCPISRIFWYRCYYPHGSRDALSPLCEIFINLFKKKSNLKKKNIVIFSGFFSESAWFHCGMCGLTNLVLNLTQTFVLLIQWFSLKQLFRSLIYFF